MRRQGRSRRQMVGPAWRGIPPWTRADIDTWRRSDSCLAQSRGTRSREGTRGSPTICTSNSCVEQKYHKLLLCATDIKEEYRKLGHGVVWAHLGKRFRNNKGGKKRAVDGVSGGKVC